MMNDIRDSILKFVKRIEYKLKNISEEDIDDDYILINPPEIVDFMKRKCGMLDLVNDSLILIRKYYPDCPVYLVFEDYCEEEGNGCIFALVISEKLSFDENYELYESLCHEFYGIENNYFDSFLNFNMDFRTGLEYYEQWRLDELNKNKTPS